MPEVDMSPDAVWKRIHQVFELELFYRRFLSQFKPAEGMNVDDNDEVTPVDPTSNPQPSEGNA